MIRAPLWFIGLLIVAAIGVGVYAYYTTPLPFGLSSAIRTPGGTNAQGVPLGSVPIGGSPARQALALGAVNVTVQGVQRNQDLTAQGRNGPPGVFTVVDVAIQNAGTQPLTPMPSDFRLVDDEGREYAVDTEATRSENAFGHRRDIFDASVPPGAAVFTFLAFETPSSANPSRLRVTLGYGDLALQ